MMPIHELLSRIRWDRAFAQGEFIIGYYDRIKARTIKVSLRAISYDEDDRFTFQVTNDNGELHNVPFHRVRDVYRDGKLIWHRDA